MRKLKRGLALLLTVWMLTAALPLTAMAEEDDPRAWDGIAYCIGTERTDEMGVLGWPGYAEEGFTFEEDGSYTIHLPEGEDSVYFIYWDENREQMEEVVTYSEDSLSADVNGHTIYAALSSGEAVELGSTVEALTLFPVPEVTSETALLGRFPEELKEIKVADLLPNSANIPNGQEIAYGVVGNDTYEIADISEAVVDFSDRWESSRNSATLAVLSTADPTNKDTVRYIVSVELPTAYNLLEMNVKDSSGKALVAPEDIHYSPARASLLGEYQISIHDSTNNTWAPQDGAILQMDFSSLFGDTSGVTATVYEGSYDTRAEITAAHAEDITAKAWGSGAEGYGMDMEEYPASQEFTLVVTRGSEDVLIKPFRVTVYTDVDYMNVSYSGLFESENSNNSDWVDASYNRSGDDTYYNPTYTIMLRKGKETTGKYYFVMDAYGQKDGQPLNGVQVIDGAYVGDYATKADAEADGAADIKASLFGGGYQADYSKGVKFSIFTIATDDLESERFCYTIQTRPYVAPLPSGSPIVDNRSLDTYFYVTNADIAEKGYSAYYMSGDDDSYYANGYQTVFILDNGGPVTAEKIHPVFTTGRNVTAYAEHNQDGKSGTVQESGKTEHDFTPGESIHYSAASERRTHLRNYWITFVTQTTEGPDLFINGITNIDYDHTENGVPVREVLLGAGSSSYHDIFVANIGNQRMTGLKVELTNARNVKLDEYWDFGETRALDAFTTTERKTADNQDTRYGELFNVTKIRLLRDGSSTGEISGTLTISADGIEPVTIKLTGKAGLPKITTTSLETAVKWVPYSHLIQTSNMRSASGVTFTATRPMPAGLTLEPDGEIYGAPQVPGTYTIGVRIAYNGQVCDTKEYTLTVLDNTDYNVWNASDYSYEIIEGPAGSTGTIGDRNTNSDISNPDASDTYILEAGRLGDYTLHSQGEYFYFTKVWLDGRELRPDQYETDEGSTRVTVIDQSLAGNRVNGTHTIAAEFREKDGSGEKGTLKRTSQNYTIQGGVNAVTPTPSTPSGGTDRPNRDKPDRDKSTPTQTTQPAAPAVPAAPSFPFVDVVPAQWFYGDVYWAWEEELMNGVSDTRFAPDAAVTQATIVTILARMRGIDLTQYADETSETVEAGKWFTESAIWAQRAGLLPDNSVFTGEDPLSRDGMAIMLVNYMTSMGMDTSVSSETAFADAGEMSEAGRQAFQTLYSYGIFKGVGDNRMDPTGSTTRAQFAALIHRISNLTENR